MKFNLTKEGGRPLHEVQMKWDKEKQESVLVVPQKKEVYCLCKYKDNPTPFVLIYNLDIDGWRVPNSEYSESMDFDKVEKWCLLSDIDDVLEGKPESMWCWEFGLSLAKTAIPALERWIEKGVSYKYGMKPEEWREILKKIKRGFEVSMSDLDGDLDNIGDLEERKRILEEHDAIRKEAFALMAEYYLDLWD